MLLHGMICHCTNVKCFGVSSFFFLLPWAGISKEQDEWCAPLIDARGPSDKSLNLLIAKICLK